MNEKRKFYNTSWFFSLIMVALFVVSYVFWGVLFVGPQRGQGRSERGLRATVGESSSQRSQQIRFPGGNRNANTNGGGNRNQR